MTDMVLTWSCLAWEGHLMFLFAVKKKLSSPSGQQESWIDKNNLTSMYLFKNKQTTKY